MSLTINIKLSELQFLLNHFSLPSETQLRIIFDDDNNTAFQILKCSKRAMEAMKKLKGSGNGNLVNALLRAREKDKLK